MDAAISTGASYRRWRCDCDWGEKCKTLGRIYMGQNHKLGSKVRVSYGPRTKALRQALVHHLHVDLPYEGDIYADYHVALHHWPPALVERNYFPERGQKTRRFTALVDATEAASYGLDSNSNTYQKWMQTAGVPQEDWRPIQDGCKYVQAPIMTRAAIERNARASTSGRSKRLAERKASVEAANALVLINLQTTAPTPQEAPPPPVPPEDPQPPAALDAASAATLQTRQLADDSRTAKSAVASAATLQTRQLSVNSTTAESAVASAATLQTRQLSVDSTTAESAVASAATLQTRQLSVDSTTAESAAAHVATLQTRQLSVDSTMAESAAASAATLQTRQLLIDSTSAATTRTLHATPRPPSPELVLPVDQLRDYIHRRLLEYTLAENEAHPRFRNAFRILARDHGNRNYIQCRKNGTCINVYPCGSDGSNKNCQLYKIMKRLRSNTILCDSCRKVKEREARQLAPKKGNRIAVDSRCRESVLTHEERLQKLIIVSKDRKRLFRRVRILEARLGIEEPKPPAAKVFPEQGSLEAAIAKEMGVVPPSQRKAVQNGTEEGSVKRQRTDDDKDDE